MTKIQTVIATLRREHPWAVHTDTWRGLFRPVGPGDHYLPSVYGAPEKITVPEDSVIFEPNLTILTPREFLTLGEEVDRIMGRQAEAKAEPVSPAPGPITVEPDVKSAPGPERTADGVLTPAGRQWVRVRRSVDDAEGRA